MICYICCTMGASVQLRQYNCTLVNNEQGTIDIKFEIKNMKDLLCSQATLNEDSDDSAEDPLSELKREGSMSLYNKRCCNEIMQQFISGLEDYSRQSTTDMDLLI